MPPLVPMHCTPGIRPQVCSMALFHSLKGTGADLSCRRLRRYTNHCFVCTEAVTEESVRDNILDLTGIDAEDLLYFSHSNIALSHLPYMVALDR